MIAGQKLYDNKGNQIALFPLESVYVSQADYETYSHESWYYATDYLGYKNNVRQYRANCYAPVDLRCIFIDTRECMAVWESIKKVHLANGLIDYLTIIVYHDNDIINGNVRINTFKLQGDVFNKTGTGGDVSGDHVHLETGIGKYTIPNFSTPEGTANYKYHFTDYTDVKRLHNYDALFINGTSIIHNPALYNWKNYTHGLSIKKKKFNFILFGRNSYHKKLRKSIFN